MVVQPLQQLIQKFNFGGEKAVQVLNANAGQGVWGCPVAVWGRRVLGHKMFRHGCCLRPAGGQQGSSLFNR
jgi:hypothetical protein